MTDNRVDHRISAAIIEPAFQVGKLNLGEGMNVPFITLFHPQHGVIYSIISPASARRLSELLAEASDTSGKMPEINE